MIGSLLYLITSRPDISYNVGVCVRYQAIPKESHMTAVKKNYKVGQNHCSIQCVV